jgi:hypothetical protein
MVARSEALRLPLNNREEQRPEDAVFELVSVVVLICKDQRSLPRLVKPKTWLCTSHGVTSSGPKLAAVALAGPIRVKTGSGGGRDFWDGALSCPRAPN